MQVRKNDRSRPAATDGPSWSHESQEKRLQSEVDSANLGTDPMKEVHKRRDGAPFKEGARWPCTRLDKPPCWVDINTCSADEPGPFSRNST